VTDLADFVSQCDVITVNCPLHDGTRGLVNAELLKHFKRGAWLVNTARGAICDKDAVAAALASGQLSGYAGDVWNVQPAPKDHIWRTAKNPLGGGNGMVPHYSGTTLDAQARYANGVKSILENYLGDKAQDPANVIVGVGAYATKACESAAYHFLSSAFTQRLGHCRRPTLRFTVVSLNAHSIDVKCFMTCVVM
jgi:formate dehydrogenase